MPFLGKPHASPTGLLFDAAFVLHDPGPNHPESPDRYRAIKKAFDRAGLFDKLTHIPARSATDDDLHLCHTRAYVATVRHDIARKSATLSTGDTAIGEHTFDIATLAAGAALSGVDAVMSGRTRNAFAAVRPPGHHATASRGMGFCVFNSAAIAARYARKVHGVERVLIADWDVHHGNGTQDIFYEDHSVFFFSTHQWPWYPGTGAASETGAGSGKGTTMNCPLPAGSGHADIVGAFRKKLMPAMAAFRPELVILSAGFDSRRADPLGRFVLRDEDFRELTEITMEIAATTANGRLLSILEGGYNLPGLGAAAVAHVEALLHP
jgi:acetoin utilization deacetylase AcuC-like enzyme